MDNSSSILSTQMKFEAKRFLMYNAPIGFLSWQPHSIQKFSEYKNNRRNTIKVKPSIACSSASSFVISIKIFESFLCKSFNCERALKLKSQPKWTLYTFLIILYSKLIFRFSDRHHYETLGKLKLWRKWHWMIRNPNLWNLSIYFVEFEK